MSERDKYLKAYYENEYNANKHMAVALAFAAIVEILLYLGFLFRWFDIGDTVWKVTNYVMPLSFLILITPICLIRTKFPKKIWFKCLIVVCFLVVIATINVILPKHGMIGWAVCIVIVNHYYHPKMGLIVYIATMVLMLLCIYGGMLLGEYDPNLLTGGIDKDGFINAIDFPGMKWPDTAQGRYDFLHFLMEHGTNRYFKVIVFYYLPRGALISIIFFISQKLNVRTYKLLVQEISVSSEIEKTNTELEVAKQIQLQTLPQNIVTSKEIELVAQLKATNEVGGDFYDYFNLDGNHTAFVIGDVSGKGIAAAMFMMKVITCFKNIVSLDKSPAETLKLVNDTIYQGNDNQMFVTVFYGILDHKTGVLKFANAGHCRPAIGHPKHFRYLECNHGFLLGTMEQTFVKDEETKLENGDMIFLYTDGLTESKNEKGEQFGEIRLLNHLNARNYDTLMEMFRDLKDRVLGFVGESEQFDDITVMSILYHGDECDYVEKEVKADESSVSTLLEFLKKFAKKHKFNDPTTNGLLIVADEIISNVVKYSYKDKDGEIYVRLFYNKDKKLFSMTVVNTGDEFNPFAQHDRGPIQQLDGTKEGGLGLLIVKQIMNDLVYDRINGKNILTLKKTIQ